MFWWSNRQISPRLRLTEKIFQTLIYRQLLRVDKELLPLHLSLLDTYWIWKEFCKPFLAHKQLRFDKEQLPLHRSLFDTYWFFKISFAHRSVFTNNFGLTKNICFYIAHSLTLTDFWKWILQSVACPQTTSGWQKAWCLYTFTFGNMMSEKSLPD